MRLPWIQRELLARALDSLSVLNAVDEGFAVAVVAAPTRGEIKQAVQLKVQSIVAQYDYDFPLMLIGPDELVFWRRRLAAAGMAGIRRVLQPRRLFEHPQHVPAGRLPDRRRCGHPFR